MPGAGWHIHPVAKKGQSSKVCGQVYMEPLVFLLDRTVTRFHVIVTYHHADSSDNNVPDTLLKMILDLLRDEFDFLSGRKQISKPLLPEETTTDDGRPWVPEDEAENKRVVSELFDKGRSDLQMAEALGVSESTVRRIRYDLDLYKAAKRNHNGKNNGLNMD
jgi:hypothetical protein